LRRVKSFSYRVSDDDLFAIFSDGVSSRFVLEDYLSLPTQEMADRILSDHGKQHDDATCVVVRVDGAVAR
jgi:phosphoserine phosphatase RsbX